MLYYYSGKSESHSVYLSVKSTCIFNIYLHVCMYVCTVYCVSLNYQHRQISDSVFSIFKMFGISVFLRNM